MKQDERELIFQQGREAGIQEALNFPSEYARKKAKAERYLVDYVLRTVIGEIEKLKEAA